MDDNALTGGERLYSVAVIGGGITGLSAAHYVLAAARTAGLNVRVTVLEQSGRLGGRIHTWKHEGFTIERGADSFLARKQPMLALARELGLEEQLTGTGRKGKKSYFLHKGRLHPMPAGMILGIPTNLEAFRETGLVSPAGKERALQDQTMPSGWSEADESLGGFLERRLGAEMVDHIAEPLLAGIYAGDLRKLSLAATFPQFKEAERRHGSVIRGMAAQAKPTAGNPDLPQAAAGSTFLSFTGGLSTVIDKLAETLEQAGALVRLHTGVQRIERGGHGEEEGYCLHLNSGEALAADAVIVTAPTYAYTGLLPDLPGITKLAQLPYVSVANVVLAFAAADVQTAFDGAGFVISRKEGRFITACTWTSSKWEHTAPPDKIVIRCYVGRSGAEEWTALSDEEIVARVRREVAELLDIHAEPLFHTLTRLNRSMPNYPVGHLETVQEARAELHRVMPQVYLTGAAFHGVGVPDCVGQAKQTAELLIDSLKNNHGGET